MSQLENQLLFCFPGRFEEVEGKNALDAALKSLTANNLITMGGKAPKDWIRLPETVQLDLLPRVPPPPKKVPIKKTEARAEKAESPIEDETAPLTDDNAVIEALTILAEKGTHCPLNSVVGAQMRKFKGRWDSFSEYANLKACIRSLEKRGFLSTGGDPPQDWVVLNLSKAGERPNDEAPKKGKKTLDHEKSSKKSRKEEKEVNAHSDTHSTTDKEKETSSSKKEKKDPHFSKKENAARSHPHSPAVEGLMSDPAVLSATVLPTSPTTDGVKPQREKREKKKDKKEKHSPEGNKPSPDDPIKPPAPDPIANFAAQMAFSPTAGDLSPVAPHSPTLPPPTQPSDPVPEDLRKTDTALGPGDVEQLKRQLVDAVGIFTKGPTYALQTEIQRLTGAVLEAHLGSGHGAGAYQEKKKPRKKNNQVTKEAPDFRAARDAAPGPPEPRRNSRKKGAGTTAPAANPLAGGAGGWSPMQ